MCNDVAMAEITLIMLVVPAAIGKKMFYSWLFPTFKVDNPHLKGSEINQVQLTTSCTPVLNVNMDLKCQSVAKSRASNLCSSADRLQCVPLISAHTNNLALQF